MSLSHPFRCAFASSKRTFRPVQLPRKCLHSSSIRRQDDKKASSPDNPPTVSPPQQQNDTLGSLDSQTSPRSTRLAPNFVDPSNPPPAVKRRLKPKDFPVYSKKEKELLRQKYTPEQIAVIEAGEAAVDPQDLADQAILHRGPMTFDYYEDFSKLRPVIDRPTPAPEENYDPNLKFKEEDDFVQDLMGFIENTPEDADRAEYMKFEDNVRLTIGKPEAELNARDQLAPEIPKLTDPIMRASAREAKTTDEDDDNAAYYRKLSKRIGMSVRDMKQLRIKQLVVRRVTNQTRMGKVHSQYYLTVAGNGRGLLGIGEGKGVEPEEANRQSILNAIRNLTPVPRYEDRTIFGDVKAKVGATELQLYTRPPGFGIRCQDKIYEMCKCAGISDLAARVTRSRNPMNTVKATFAALMSQRLPEDIARGRGKKLVDVRKVYYANRV